jgi:hypothetical protein
VGAGGADAYFEHVEDGDAFVWQEMWVWGKDKGVFRIQIPESIIRCLVNLLSIF